MFHHKSAGYFDSRSGLKILTPRGELRPPSLDSVEMPPLSMKQLDIRIAKLEEQLISNPDPMLSETVASLSMRVASLSKRIEGISKGLYAVSKPPQSKL